MKEVAYKEFKQRVKKGIHYSYSSLLSLKFHKGTKKKDDQLCLIDLKFQYRKVPETVVFPGNTLESMSNRHLPFTFDPSPGAGGMRFSEMIKKCVGIHCHIYYGSYLRSLTIDRGGLRTPVFY